jgi:hypothetical protein
LSEKIRAVSEAPIGTCGGIAWLRTS